VTLGDLILLEELIELSYLFAAKGEEMNEWHKLVNTDREFTT
jgi:hypothetical protein